MDTRLRERVGSGLLIYDGDCGLCSRTAAWLRRRLPARYRVEASQRMPDLDVFSLTRREVHEAAYWVDPDGTTHRAHRAIKRALQASGGMLGWLAGLMGLWPIEPVAERVYFLIARNRHRFPGSSDSCRV